MQKEGGGSQISHKYNNVLYGSALLAGFAYLAREFCRFKVAVHGDRAAAPVVISEVKKTQQERERERAERGGRARPDYFLCVGAAARAATNPLAAPGSKTQRGL